MIQTYLNLAFPNKIDTNLYEPILCKQFDICMLDLRANFKMKHVKTGLECELGCGEEESKEQLLVCRKIPESSKYEDLFATEVEKQMKMAAILKERFLKRKVLLKQN